MKAFSLCLAVVCVLLSIPASAALKGLDCMVVGTEVIEIADTWQITHAADGVVSGAAISPDGKQVAFLTEVDDKSNLCLVPSTGGKVTTAMESSGDIMGAPGKTETAWNLSYRPVWSADGRYICLTASAETVSDNHRTDQSVLLVLTSRGEYLTQVPAGEKMHITGEPIVSPDGIHVVTAAQTRDRERGQNNPFGMLVFDISKGTSRFLSCRPGWTSPVWSPDGRQMTFPTTESAGEDVKMVIRELDVETGESRVVEEVAKDESLPWLSPDGVLRAVERGSAISVVNAKTGASAVVVKSRNEEGGPSGVLWAPNSPMFIYFEDNKIMDHAGAREGQANIMWLAGVETHKLNTLCLATGCDDVAPTWSTDSLRMAYAHKGRLHVVALSKRKPTPEEKARAGLPLTEQEQMQLLQANLRNIGLAILEYYQDTQGELPDAGSIEQDLEDYLSDRDLVFRPNASQGYFRYFRENLVNLRDTDLANTILAEFDLGYDWKAVVYADGHSEIVKK